MAQPPGFEDANHPNLVCYFYKSLCFKLLELETIGLMFFFFFVAKMGLLKLIFWFIFVCEESEFCNCGSFFYCVDDIIITRSAIDVVQQVIIDHTTEFDIKDLGLHHYFLGIQITRNEYGFQDKVCSWFVIQDWDAWVQSLWNSLTAIQHIA